MARRRKKRTTVLVQSLRDESPLQESVQPGLRAFGPYSARVEDPERRATDGIDYDAATLQENPNANRWDYFIGIRGSRRENGIIGVEVHSARDSEVSVVIAKKNHSKPLFEGELKDGTSVKEWVWLASGRVQFSPNSRFRRALATARIRFEGRKLKIS